MSDIGLPNLNKPLRESIEKIQEAAKEKERFKQSLLEELRTINKKLDEIITLLKSK